MTTPDTLKAVIERVYPKSPDLAQKMQHVRDLIVICEAATSAINLQERLETSAEIQTSMAMERTNLRERVKELEGVIEGAEKAFDDLQDQADEINKHLIDYDIAEGLSPETEYRRAKLLKSAIAARQTLSNLAAVRKKS